jgi:hypothetical protein
MKCNVIHKAIAFDVFPHHVSMSQHVQDSILELLSNVLQLHTLRLQCQTRGHGTCPTTGKTHQLQAPQAHFCVFFRRQFRRRHGVVTLPLLNQWDGMYTICVGCGWNDSI